MNASLQDIICQVIMGFSNIHTVNCIWDIFPILNVKKMDRQRKDKELTNLSTKYVCILQTKKVANLSAKKYVLPSHCGSPIKMIFLGAAKENI